MVSLTDFLSSSHLNCFHFFSILFSNVKLFPVKRLAVLLHLCGGHSGPHICVRELNVERVISPSHFYRDGLAESGTYPTFYRVHIDIVRPLDGYKNFNALLREIGLWNTLCFFQHCFCLWLMLLDCGSYGVVIKNVCLAFEYP